MSNTTPSQSANQPTEQTEVLILLTLHQFHAEAVFYTFNVLSRIIERLEPTDLAVELTHKDIQTRREQGVKREYQESVYPLLDKHDYAVYPLEPDDPLFFYSRQHPGLQHTHSKLGEHALSGMMPAEKCGKLTWNRCKLVKLFQEAQEELKERGPEKYGGLGLYVPTLLEPRNSYSDVNRGIHFLRLT